MIACNKFKLTFGRVLWVKTHGNQLVIFPVAAGLFTFSANSYIVFSGMQFLKIRKWKMVCMFLFQVILSLSRELTHTEAAR